jgi:hypothetical protein
MPKYLKTNTQHQSLNPADYGARVQRTAHRYAKPCTVAAFKPTGEQLETTCTSKPCKLPSLSYPATPSPEMLCQSFNGALEATNVLVAKI